MASAMDPAVAAAMNETVLAPINRLSEMAFVYRSLFYLVTPNETSFEGLKEVPNYHLKSMPYAPFVLGMEVFLLWIQGKRLPRWNDAITSICTLLLLLLPVVVLGQLEMSLYIWVHENYRVLDLPWSAWYTWAFCVLGVDLGFYLWHRAAHEINLIWAFHQVHHTPEDFNIFTGLRLPALNRYVAIIFYLPCAFFFPPSVFSVHYQLNYMFQIWIHTDAIPSLGFLDYFINNPSLHRVHHGRNRYCIDKNYGAVFSFWDYLFGTFEREKKDETIYYGLVHPIRTWDNIYIQVHHLKSMWNTTFNYNNWWEKVCVYVKGPGWYPGAPRLGKLEDIPKVPEDKDVYDKKLPLLGNLYLLLHLVIGFYLFQKIKLVNLLFGANAVYIVYFQALYVLWDVANIGWILEHKPYVPFLEAIRCGLYFLLEWFIHDALDPTWVIVLRTTFFVSCAFWIGNQNFFKDERKKTQ